MFEFGDGEYKWCHACKGNVRKDAYLCRFCRTANGSKLLKNKVCEAPAHIIDEAAKWMHSWEETYKLLPEPLQRRILVADAETPAPHIGIEPHHTPEEAREKNRNSEMCGPDAPSDAALGLVWDLLLAIDEKHPEKTDAIMEHPKLQLLGISGEKVRAEKRQREKEQKEGKPCQYCRERIVENECRFCTGTPEKKPQPVEIMDRIGFGRLNRELLRTTILWEAARQKIDAGQGLEQEEESKVTEDLLEKYEITEDEIQAEILRQRQDPDAVPYSSWRRRMADLQLKSFSTTEWHALQDMVSLGNATAHHKLDHEALIVFDHAMKRWTKNPHHKEQQFILKNGKASVYMSTGDYEKYHALKNSAREHLPEKMRDHDKDSNKNIERMFTHLVDDKNKDRDPLEVYEQQMKRLEERQKQAQENIKNMESLVPGLGDMMKTMHENLIGKMMTTNRTIAEGKSALMKGNYDVAIEKFQSLVDDLDESEPLNGMKKSFALCDLGKALQKSGEPEKAEEKFLTAIQLGKDLIESDSTGHELALALQNYAIFLKEIGRFDDAKKSFEEAEEVYKQCHETQCAKFNIKEDAFATGKVEFKEQYADLLELMGNTEEAAKLKEEIEELRVVEAKWKQKNTENRRAFLEGLPRPE